MPDRLDRKPAAYEVRFRAMIEQFPAKATSIILAGAEEEHGFNVDMVKREVFHGREIVTS
jgi:hypothetical protein